MVWRLKQSRNVDSGIEVMPFPRVMEVRFWQPEKAWDSSSVGLSWKVSDWSPLFRKALAWIDFTLEGMTRLVRDVQLLKASFAMVSSLAGRTRFWRDWQVSKADSPMVFNFELSSMDWSEVQRRKASVGMVVMASGRLIWMRLLQFLKAEVPRVVRLSGSEMEGRLEQ